MINQLKSQLVEEYQLKEGENKIEIIIKNALNDLEQMFYGCKTLINID